MNRASESLGVKSLWSADSDKARLAPTEGEREDIFREKKKEVPWKNKTCEVAGNAGWVVVAFFFVCVCVCECFTGNAIHHTLNCLEFSCHTQGEKISLRPEMKR